MLAALSMLVLCVNAPLVEGRAAYAGLKWDKAETHLRLACDVPGSTSEERYEAHDLLARTLLATGRTQAAIETYSRLLSTDPHAATPRDAAPKVKEAFRKAKESLFPEGYVLLRALPSAPNRTEVELVDPWKRAKDVVLLEAVGEAAEFGERVMTRRGGQFSAQLRVPEPGARLRYFVVARNAEGVTIANVGTGDAPSVVWGPGRGGVNAADVPTEHRPALAPAAEPPVNSVRARTTTGAASTPGTTTTGEPEPGTTTTGSTTHGASLLSATAPRPRWLSITLGAVSVAALATGIGFGVTAGTQHQTAVDARWASETVQHDQVSRQNALAANLFYAGSAVTGVTAAILFWVW
jgi:hypothetical protein